MALIHPPFSDALKIGDICVTKYKNIYIIIKENGA